VTSNSLTSSSRVLRFMERFNKKFQNILCKS